MGSEVCGLECALCHENYSSECSRHTPRLLHGCGHTICENCCGYLLEVRFAVAQVVCPFDRIPSAITDSSLSSLKKNFALLELIDSLRKKSTNLERSPQELSETSEHMKDLVLGIPCDEDSSHTAIFFCTVCESHLCAECSARTHVGRVLSKHCRVPVSEKPRPRPMCSFHSAYALEFVCQEIDCSSDSRLMCLLCRDYGRHKGHRHSLLDVEAAELRKRVKEALSDFKRFAADLNNWSAHVSQSITEMIESVNGSHAVARRQVNAHFQRLREELDAHEESAVSLLDTHVSDRVGALSTHQQQLTLISAEVSAISTQLQKSAEYDDARLMDQRMDLIHMLDAVRSRQHDIASAPSGVSLDARIPFTFTSDNKIHLGSNVDIRLVVLGLDGAGKTTILFRLKNEEFRQTVPTIGFNVETVQYKNFKLTIWDVGGLPKLRPLWKHYYLNTQALVFVIDSSHPSRFVEAQSELVRILAERELADACFLVILNRRLPSIEQPNCELDSSSIDQLVMNINRFSNGRTVLIHQCNAMTGVGLWEAVESLTNNLMLIRSQKELLNSSAQL